MRKIPRQAENCKRRGAGMAAATFGRKTDFPSAAALRNAASDDEAIDEIADGIAEWRNRRDETRTR